MGTVDWSTVGGVGVENRPIDWSGEAGLGGGAVTTILLQHSDELGSYNTGRSLSLISTTDKKQLTRRSSNLGSYRMRRWKLTHSSKEYRLVLAKIEEDVVLLEG